MVPLALALLNISHPDMPVIDQLSRLTHDADADVAQSAIMVRERSRRRSEERNRFSVHKRHQRFFFAGRCVYFFLFSPSLGV